MSETKRTDAVAAKWAERLEGFSLSESITFAATKEFVYGFIADLAENGRQLERENARLREALNTLLPMADDYAAGNPPLMSEQFKTINAIEAARAALKDADG